MTHQLLVLISKNTFSLLLDEKLDFSHHIKEKLGKNMKSQCILPRHNLVTIKTTPGLWRHAIAKYAIQCWPC